MTINDWGVMFPRLALIFTFPAVETRTFTVQQELSNSPKSERRRRRRDDVAILPLATLAPSGLFGATQRPLGQGVLGPPSRCALYSA